MLICQVDPVKRKLLAASANYCNEQLVSLCLAYVPEQDHGLCGSRARMQKISAQFEQTAISGITLGFSPYIGMLLRNKVQKTRNKGFPPL